MKDSYEMVEFHTTIMTSQCTKTEMENKYLRNVHKIVK